MKHSLSLQVVGLSRGSGQPPTAKSYTQNLHTHTHTHTSSSSSSSSECSAQGQVLHCKRRNLGCSSSEDRCSTQTQEPMLQFYQGLNRCSSFRLLSAPHSLFNIWADLKRSENIPGAQTWRSGEWIWLTGPSGFRRNSPSGVKYQFHQGFWPYQRSENPNHSQPPYIHVYFINCWVQFCSH